jgi:hypothetical protein
MNMIFINYYHAIVALTLDGHILAREVGPAGVSPVRSKCRLARSDPMPSSSRTPPLCV